MVFLRVDVDTGLFFFDNRCAVVVCLFTFSQSKAFYIGFPVELAY